MCELFMMSSRYPTDVNLSIGELAKHGAGDQRSHDGWGIAYYEGLDVRLIKEAGPAGSSDWFPFIASRRLKSCTVIAHIRRVSQGARTYWDTQPFVRELGGRKHVFAHNGDLGDAFEKALKIGTYRPIGETDSEYAFCSLLHDIQPLWDEPRIPDLSARRAIVDRFARRLRNLGPANFIYADGDAVFAHGHIRRQADGAFRPPGLHSLTRHCLESYDLIDTPALSINAHHQNVTLVASVPLSEETWCATRPGDVIVVRDGERIPSSDTGQQLHRG